MLLGKRVAPDFLPSASTSAITHGSSTSAPTVNIQLIFSRIPEMPVMIATGWLICWLSSKNTPASGERLVEKPLDQRSCARFVEVIQRLPRDVAHHVRADIDQHLVSHPDADVIVQIIQDAADHHDRGNDDAGRDQPLEPRHMAEVQRDDEVAQRRRSTARGSGSSP